MSDNTLVPDFGDFARDIFPGQEMCAFHRNYYRLLQLFATRTVRKLIITMPPQHGKSHGASVLLPAYILGIDPDRKITIASYSAGLSSRFNRRVQRLIDQGEYAEIFPATMIKRLGTGNRDKSGGYLRTANLVEVIDRAGELFSVGRGGPLTGNRVDTVIIDDLYKNAGEANSPTVRENCWDWYTAVVKTRLHNDSNELIVSTRWHEEDLVGMIGNHERIVALESWEQLENWSGDTWLQLNLEALKSSAPTEIDPRQNGEPLWEARQNRELLLKKRALDPLRFECMYQGYPSPPVGLLYGNKFRTYDRLPPDGIVGRSAYVDTADTGEDYLCAIAYNTDDTGAIYVVDVVYTGEPMEVTEGSVADMLTRNDIRIAFVESNNGGRGFARAVKKIASKVVVEWFHQSGNKESRILTNAPTVLEKVMFPADWRDRWPTFAHHVTTYRRLFRANRWHDAADVLTGIVEKQIEMTDSRRKIKSVRFS